MPTLAALVLALELWNALLLCTSKSQFVHANVIKYTVCQAMSKMHRHVLAKKVEPDPHGDQ